MKVEWLVFAKGMLMGAADIVPGVSGGTIAFITGIYARLLTAVKNVAPAFFRLLKQRDLSEFVRACDLVFLSTLLAGIVVSIVSFARIITWLLENHPIPLWSFFFGLIIASILIIGREVNFRSLNTYICLFVGAAFALFISRSGAVQLEPSLMAAFISGAIAICAMILPGISGSFILVLLGTYGFVIGALKDAQMDVVGLFCLGCLVGLLSIANVLSWAFRVYPNPVMAFLTGIMIGALEKVWPWKEVLSTRINRHGEEVPFLEQSVMPGTYEALNGSESLAVVALVSAMAAFILVYGIERYASRSTKQG